MYRLLSPENVLIEVDNVKEFIQQYGLTTRVFQLLNGSSKQYRGWRLAEICYDRSDEEQLKYILRNTFSRAKRRIIKNSDIFCDLLDSKYPNIPLIEQIYLFEKNITSPPTCVICGDSVFFHSEKRGYYNTCSKRCMNGVRVGFTPEKIAEIKRVLDNPEILKSVMDTGSQIDVAQVLGVSKTMVGNYARKYNISDGFSSNLERSLASWLDTLGLCFTTDRKILDGYEIDRYCPNKKFGIEINGLYRHSEISGEKSKEYHKNKIDNCASKAIRLISIFEDEWYDRNLAVKTIILTQLGLQEKGIGARHLTVCEVDKHVAKILLEKHHLQGSCGFSISIGAFFNDVLVGVMVFGKPTRQSRYEYELKRYCTDGKIYPGLASKMFSFFVNSYHPSNVVSFCDKRFFTGRTYEIMGFIMDGLIPPDYSYTCDYRTRHHKAKFKLKNIARLTGIISPLSESEQMKLLGYDRVWDAGKIRFVWKS